MSYYDYGSVTAAGTPLAIDTLLANNNTCSDGYFENVELDCLRDNADGGAPANSPVFRDDELVDDDEIPIRPARAPRGPRGGEKLFEPKGDSIYHHLEAHGLLTKLTGIVLAKVSMPWHLRDDAVQEIQLTWSRIKAKEGFARSQLAQYAFLAGQHAALNLRRRIGAVVAIPGALFRNGRGHRFMQSIGAAVNPMDIKDFEDSLALSVSVDNADGLPLAVDADFVAQRLAGLNLTRSQKKVARMVLVHGMDAESIAIELNLRKGYVERLITLVTNELLAREDRALKHEPVPAGRRLC